MGRFVRHSGVGPRCGENTHAKSRIVQTDTQTAFWLFGRDDQRVKIERLCDAEDDAPTLVITANDDPPRTYAFDTMVALMRFQSDMEEFLVTTGWSLLEFFPERRTGRDRRTSPRIDERRRWWTDAIRRDKARR